MPTSGMTSRRSRHTAMYSAPPSPRAASPRSTPAPAESSAGVFAVVSAQNAGPLGKGDFNTAKLLAGPEVQHYHQAVAIVVARTFEEARSAAGKIKVRYVAEPGAYDLAKAKDGAQKPPGAVRDRAGLRRRRFRRRLCGGAREARRDLHHPGPDARDDGAVRVDRGLERRRAHGLDVKSDDRLGP